MKDSGFLKLEGKKSEDRYQLFAQKTASAAAVSFGLYSSYFLVHYYCEIHKISLFSDRFWGVFPFPMFSSDVFS